MTELYNSDGLFVLDHNFKKLVYIDQYVSFIWIERFRDYSEFELYMRADQNLLQYFTINNFIMRDYHAPKYRYEVDGVTYYNGEPELMIIEKIQINTSEEDGNYYVISGRSAECLFNRRVLRGTYTFANYELTALVPVVKNDDFNIENPFPFTWSYTVSNVDGSEKILPLVEPSRGYNIYDLFHEFSKKANCGLRVLVDESASATASFWLYFYVGNDRTRGNEALQPVIFSPEYHNLVSSKYVRDTTNVKNICYIASDGEWYQEKFQTVFYNPRLDSYSKKEMFLKSDVPLKDTSGNIRPDADVLNDLSEQGMLELLNHRPVQSLDFDVISTEQFRYQHEYFLGDLVTVDNGFGISVTAKVVEVSQIWDENGYRIIPKLEVV